MLSMLILCTGGYLSSSISFENLAVHRDNFSCMPDNVVIFKKKKCFKNFAFICSYINERNRKRNIVEAEKAAAVRFTF